MSFLVDLYTRPRIYALTRCYTRYACLSTTCYTLSLVCRSACHALDWLHVQYTLVCNTSKVHLRWSRFLTLNVFVCRHEQKNLEATLTALSGSPLFRERNLPQAAPSYYTSRSALPDQAHTRDVPRKIFRCHDLGPDISVAATPPDWHTKVAQSNHESSRTLTHALHNPCWCVM
jgi:hypothetical protein